MKGKIVNIETERLELVALTPTQLEWWLNDCHRLECELNCLYRAEPMEGLFRQIVAGQLAAAQRDPGHYVWHSFWFLIRKSDRTVVGSADFKDLPDSGGLVEIGYGLGREYEGRGYMTEAVCAMCRWAISQDNVRHVTAETDLDGLASQKLLLRCGFREWKRGETLWWIL